MTKYRMLLYASLVLAINPVSATENPEGWQTVHFPSTLGEQKPLYSTVDESGKVRTTVFRFTLHLNNVHDGLDLVIPDNYVAVGGGADMPESLYATSRFLTGSYPDLEANNHSIPWNRWSVTTYAPLLENNDLLSVFDEVDAYVIGMKVEGLTAKQLWEQIEWKTNFDGGGNKKAVSVESNETLALSAPLGGGGRAGYRDLLTAMFLKEKGEWQDAISGYHYSGKTWSWQVDAQPPLRNNSEAVYAHNYIFTIKDPLRVPVLDGFHYYQVTTIHPKNQAMHTASVSTLYDGSNLSSEAAGYALTGCGATIDSSKYNDEQGGVVLKTLHPSELGTGRCYATARMLTERDGFKEEELPENSVSSMEVQAIGVKLNWVEGSDESQITQKYCEAKPASGISNEYISAVAMNGKLIELPVPDYDRRFLPPPTITNDTYLQYTSGADVFVLEANSDPVEVKLSVAQVNTSSRSPRDDYRWLLFIDYNQDGKFEIDQQELLVNQRELIDHGDDIPDEFETSIDFVVPDFVITDSEFHGYTLARVVMVDGKTGSKTAINGCSNNDFQFGQVADFLVYIREPTDGLTMY